jgi:hypothetical protein
MAAKGGLVPHGEMGICPSNLPNVASLAPQFTTFAFVSSLFFVGKRWQTCLFFFTFLIGYDLTVRLGGNVQNPLSTLSGNDYAAANQVMNIVYIVLCFGFCNMAWFFFRVVGMEEMIVFRKKIPSYNLKAAKAVLVVDEEDNASVQEMVPAQRAPAPRHGMENVQASWLHIGVTLVYFLGGIAVPQIWYDQWMLQPAQQQSAFIINLVWPPVAGVLYLIYCLFWPDEGTFGPNEKRLEKLGLDRPQVKQLVKENRGRVLWTVVPIIGFSLIGPFWIGGTRLLTPSTDYVWLSSVGYFAFCLLLVGCLFLLRRSQVSGQSLRQFFTNPVKKSKKNKGEIDDSAPNFYTKPTDSLNQKFKTDPLLQ